VKGKFPTVLGVLYYWEVTKAVKSMTKQSLQKRTEGWVYAVHWQDRKKEVKIGFSTDLRKRLSDFLTYSSDVLVVLKAFRANKSQEGELHEKFERQRINGEWFMIDDALKQFFKFYCPCDTKEARQEFGSFQKERIIWRPLGLQAATRLQNAHQNTRLPYYVKNARSYVLWTVRELNEHDFCCTPNAIISHSVNNEVGDDWKRKVLYDEKTIYNRISSLSQEGLIVKGEDKLYTLTEAGHAELDKLELQMLERRERLSARPLYPCMPLDRKKTPSSH
jgi:hypothetical protein